METKNIKKTWFPGDTLNFAIGQGFIEVTPLALMVALNVFASDGYLVTPYILKKVDGVDSGLSTKTLYSCKNVSFKSNRLFNSSSSYSDMPLALLLNNLAISE